MKMKKTRLLFFLALFCAACTEQSTEPEIIIDPIAEPGLKAAHFYLTDQSHYRVEYKYNNLLEKEIHLKENGEPLSVTTYKYDNYRLIEQQLDADPKAGKFTFQYNADTLIFSEYKDSAEKPQNFTRTYSYPDKNTVRIVEKDLVSKTEQHIYLYIEEGNIVRTKTLDPVTDQVKEENQFEYDQHPNPYFPMTGKAGNPMFRSQRNVTLMRTLFRNGESVNSEIRYAYEYKGAWPVKRYQLLTNDKKLLEQEYFYE